MLHVAIAVTFQTMIGLVFRNWWLGVFLAAAFFGGREITQAEYRWIEAFGHGHRANMPWWGGFAPSAWTMKSVLDVSAPIAATVLIALIAQR